MFGKTKNWKQVMLDFPIEFMICLWQYRRITLEENDTLGSLFDYLTEGDRYEKFTVTNFELIEEIDGKKTFKISQKDVGTLSGGGSTDQFTFAYESRCPTIVSRKTLSQFRS